MTHVELVAVLGACAWLRLVIEMVRRRRVSEGYSFLWLLSAVVLFTLAVWRQLLEILAQMMGIFYAPTALFVVAFGFTTLLIMQQSAIICQLERDNSDLTQGIALLSLRVERVEQQLAGEGHHGQDTSRADG